MKKIFLTKRGPTSPRRTSRGGFTAFFAVLVASLALSVGLAIYDLLIRQLTLSQVATQSVYAIFAADTAIECALYWDNKASSLNGSPSIFATSSASGNAVFSGTANCNTQNIVAQGPPQVDIDSGQYTGCVINAWCKLPAPGPSSATTIFIWQHLAKEGSIDPSEPFILCAPGIGSDITAAVVQQRDF